MALVIEDDEVAELIGELAYLSGKTESDVIRQAVESEIQRLRQALPLSERLRRLREAHPLPPPTGLEADKAFFDELSGDP